VALPWDNHSRLALLTLLLGAQLVLGQAGLAGGKSHWGISAAQKKLLDGRLATEYEDSKRLLPENPDLPRYLGEYHGKYLPMAEKAAAEFGVPKDIFARLIQMESNWNPEARSADGAIGLAQLMPDTARRLGIDPYDPEANLKGGALYLKQQYMRFRSWKLAVAAYNAGPEAVVAYKDVPPFPETESYVKTIMGR